MFCMLVTLETSHFEMSPLNNFVLANMSLMNISLMSVTLETSQSPSGPCGLLEQSPFGDSLRHASTALRSSALDCGENAGVEMGMGGAIIGLNSKDREVVQKERQCEAWLQVG